MATASNDDSLQRLRVAISELAALDAGDVVEQARAQARERVRSILSDALSQSMLDHIEGRLGLSGAPPLQVEPGAPEPSADEPQAIPADEPQPIPAENETFAHYVYGVIAEGAEHGLHELTGVHPSEPVGAVRAAGLAAVVSRVPADEFEDAKLRSNLSDMEWVERLARSHQEVLDATQMRTTVIPMRMCTVYQTEGGVREMLSREHDAFAEALEHLAGKAEWGVKVFARRRSPTSPPEPQASTGAGYMDQRRRDRDALEEFADAVQEAALEIHERLCTLADDGLVAPPQRPEVSGHSGDMALNGVYLVREDDDEAFASAVAELTEQFESLGLELVLTGPWPAYNFVPGAIGASW